ncbi:hypothetical protein I350_06531 [Cryptococcus amylolentus CBS 6273]|uniref:Major facilitator superfamily (MFS) profile domain-containing protein n=1 Tax=Cryptococcus amylolentus CBS 6273 TaxID=1296118 RepID=A0A1E3JLG1_9TREE|nr:hypothetical protein I350_06531 [Cryptococcus amylolentus CBS 6273]
MDGSSNEKFLQQESPSPTRTASSVTVRNPSPPSASMASSSARETEKYKMTTPFTSRPGTPETPHSTVLEHPPLPNLKATKSRRSRGASTSSRVSRGTGGAEFSPLERRTSSQTAELQNELRRHVSLHGVPQRHDEHEVLELRQEVDLEKGKGKEEVTIIDWLPHDPGHPYNFATWRKYAILTAANIATYIAAANLASVAVLADFGTAYFDISREKWELSLTVGMLAIACAPLALAPLSESFGRNPVYQVTSVITAVMWIPQIWSNHNYSGVLAARFFQGVGMSVSNSMVGGTVADLFRPDQRGFAMSFFTASIFWAQGTGITFSGWAGEKLGLQWAWGIQAIIAALSVVYNIFFMRETRADVLLSRRAKAMTKKTGKKHIAVVDLEKTALLTLIKVSIIRPLHYLITEPIVTALSLWFGFAWGVIFLGQSSVMLVFEQYGFSAAEAGSFEIAMVIGATIGLFAQFHQESLYRRAAIKHNGKAPPEARLYWAAYGGLLFPLALYVYAWTGQPSVHWAVPGVALVFMNWGVFMIYSGVFTYLADAYEIYSSSAQAAQSFCRNVLGGVFPLFVRQMYKGMGYPQASTLVASVALGLATAPFLLLMFGKKLRAKSKVTSQLFQDKEEEVKEERAASA